MVCVLTNSEEESPDGSGVSGVAEGAPKTLRYEFRRARPRRVRAGASRSPRPRGGFTARPWPSMNPTKSGKDRHT